MVVVAIPRGNEYPELSPDNEYKVEKIRSDRHIILKGSKRQYLANCFDLYYNYDYISFARAYELYKQSRR